MSNRERILYWPETYSNIKELGRGVSGVVYKAIKKDSPDQVVAIKLVDINQNRASWDQVQGEINALLTLNSPDRHVNIIKLIECFRHKTTAIFVLEYIDGGTLEDFMYTFDEGLPIPLVSHIVYQIISAIQFMNNHKCSHRDIKPANILLLSNKKKSASNDAEQKKKDFFNIFKDGTSNNYTYDADDLPVIKITDYGYASITKNDNDMHSTLAGSPLYMPPEIIHIILSPNLEPRKGKIICDTNNEGYNPLLVDIWAIGAVAFRLLTGRELINEIFPLLNQSTVLAALVNLAKMVDSSEFQSGLDTIPKKMKEFGVKDEVCIDFITSLLKLEPKQRLSLGDALNHPFLQTGKASFDLIMKEYLQQQTESTSKIPTDISKLTEENPSNTSSSSTKDNATSSQPSQQTTSSQQDNKKDPQQQQPSSQPSTQPQQPSPQQQQQPTHLEVPKTTTSSAGSGSSKTPPWNFQRPSSFHAPTMMLSPQRRTNFKLFPSLLPKPTEDSPPQDTMIWRSPPMSCNDSFTWTTISQDPIFQVQHGVLTSILKTFSSNSDYEYRIITQTKSPVEIAVSNYKESILYMYNICKTVVTPQLISLSTSSNESSIQTALCSILHQLDQEQETLSFASGWTVLFLYT
ncbi:putative protein serine/threonine kinase [Heterostelium album PN500]|uniref:Protein kinase domain-containing protein n=1 Tax=Heterostelium pallidum (strain ATCC 26659 / Pp 5 / PN500) TaxID=670386 RepID=D3B9M2_HETP5|nr:putative protein serine/threonine kinase [Heterostelium album PN500]EFA81934.1 putative protein serine/threonine kinase [Heterostelium album PN500]|eukprot:XP_020434051.1 putative protein serine/threonine kinase [Heterostelium album PN500]